MNTVITVNSATTMKTSQFIRNAVDAHLSPDGKDHPEKNQDTFICTALLHYRRATAGYLNDYPAYGKARELITQELLEYQDSCSSPIYYTTIGNILNWQWEGAELQAVRFMYAEMLACYFESIGD